MAKWQDGKGEEEKAALCLVLITALFVRWTHHNGTRNPALTSTTHKTIQVQVLTSTTHKQREYEAEVRRELVADPSTWRDEEFG